MRVSFGEAARVWLKIGFLSFGGPAGQVALMHQELVNERRWIDEERFLHALNYCMLLPGPEAQQLATYIGWLMHRTRGGLVAGILFVLPGACAVLALSALYASFHDVRVVSAAFFGLKAAVLAVVVEAVVRIGRRALKSRLLYVVAALGFLALFAFHLPFPAVVLGAGLFGFVGSRLVPAAFPEPARVKAAGHGGTVIEHLAAVGELEHTAPSWRQAVRVLVVCGALWIAPIVALGAAFGWHGVFVQAGIFFSKAATVTFGGAYAVLA
jgi:chromate transporter